MKKLYISDLDQTILNEKAKLSNSSKIKIKILMDNDIHFTVATARSYNSVRNIFSGIDLKYPIIELNGTMLTDYNTENRFFVNDINPVVVKDIVEKAKTMSMYPFYTIIDTNNKAKLFPPVIRNKGGEWFIENRIKDNDTRINLNESRDILDSDEIKYLSLTFIYRLDQVSILKDYIDKFKYRSEVSLDFFENPYSKNWQWLSVQSKLSKKGLAVNKFKEIFDLNDYETIVFGDNLNDYNMFEVADRSYAVENAKEKLKSIATGVIGLSTDDAVLDFILKENNLI